MKKSIDLYCLVNTIANALSEGITIGFRNFEGEQEVVVSDSEKGFEICSTVNHARLICARDYRIAYGGASSKNEYAGQKTVKQPASVTPVKSEPDKVKPATAVKKKNAKWWSRFNFEKNIMKMTLFALQDRYPYEDGYRQDMFAAKLAAMMSWKESTAKRHITQAAKMGIINRAVFGTTYYIMGVNNEDAQTLQEEMADREQEPEMMPLPDSPLAHEGRIQFEQEFDKAVDETVLP